MQTMAVGLTLNTCLGCLGSFRCFSKTQNQTKFVLVAVGLMSQYHCERLIIRHYALFQCIYAQSDPFYISSLNFKALVKGRSQGSLKTR